MESQRQKIETERLRGRTELETDRVRDRETKKDRHGDKETERYS
ncbi:hypothetical protein T02_1459 [Trichinella nativa]|uniref:Uncharacterized protein n=1 Tax=Trichinella nativa TaxID=6335 RepID=A0A0V1KJ00_9BILA|nr:hypothetical protein T02_1459 [Trichinella nativa]